MNKKISKRTKTIIDSWIVKFKYPFTKEELYNAVENFSNSKALAISWWIIHHSEEFSNRFLKACEHAFEITKRQKVDPIVFNSPYDVIGKFPLTSLKLNKVDPSTLDCLKLTTSIPEYGVEIYTIVNDPAYDYLKEFDRMTSLYSEELLNYCWEDFWDYVVFKFETKKIRDFTQKCIDSLTEKERKYFNKDLYRKNLLKCSEKYVNSWIRRDKYKLLKDYIEYNYFTIMDIYINRIQSLLENNNELQTIRESIRTIIDTHFGVNTNPWCILQTNGDSFGELTNSSLKNWLNYSIYPKKIAFQNGTLLAFYANDEYSTCWWNRQNQPSKNLQLTGEFLIPNDTLKRKCNIEIDDNNNVIYKNIHFGNDINGVYKAWYDLDHLRLETNFKDGEYHGKCVVYNKKGSIIKKYNYYLGQLNGVIKSYYDNGNLLNYYTYINGVRNGKYKIFDTFGTLIEEGVYCNGELIKYESF